MPTTSLGLATQSIQALRVTEKFLKALTRKQKNILQNIFVGLYPRVYPVNIWSATTGRLSVNISI